MEELTKVTGKTIKCMVEVSLRGLTAEDMKANTLKIKNKVKAPFIGLMGGNIWDNGLMESNMVEVLL